MVRTNYARGADKERRIKRKFEKAGWICIRSAKSNSIVDLVCINPKEKVIRFIQVKPKKFSKTQSDKLLKEAEFLNNEYICNFEVAT